MTPENQNGSLYKAGTASYDFHDPAQALDNLLKLALELCGAERVALYQYDEASAGFIPRMAIGISMGQLGRLSATTDNQVIRQALSARRAASNSDGRSTLGLPLAPGTVACAPCLSSGQTMGLLFIGSDSTPTFSPDALAALDVLGIRIGEVLVLARQTASQSYLFHKPAMPSRDLAHARKPSSKWPPTC